MDVSRINEFMKGPLVTWLETCFENPTQISYADIVDGVLIHHVFLQMNLEAQETDIHSSNNDPTLRSRNLKMILANLLQCYSDCTDELALPDIDCLARDPELYVNEAEQLLRLLLGCAVQCPNQQNFINKIMLLDDRTQEAIAESIIKVVRNPHIQEAFENAKCMNQELPKSHQNAHSTPCKNGLTANEYEISNVSEILNSSTRSDKNEFKSQEVELLKWKSKVKRQEKELNETVDDLNECKEELQLCKEEINRLQKENERLVLEARNAKSYRDELDVVNEKAERVDRLEQEVKRYKEKLTNVDLHKTRLDELQEDNRLLVELKNDVIEQLSSEKEKFKKVKSDLEEKIFYLKEQIKKLQTNKEHNDEKFLKLCEENGKLERLVQSKANVSIDNDLTTDLDDSTSSIIDKSLAEQLMNSTQSQALKLELENRRLSTLLDSFKEHPLLENSNRFLNLEEDKQKLAQKINSLQNDVQDLTQQNMELESLFEKSKEENQKLQQQLINESNSTYEDLENMCVEIVKETNNLRFLLENLHKKLHDFELNPKDENIELKEPKILKNLDNEMKFKLSILKSGKKLFQKGVKSGYEVVKEVNLIYNITSKIVEEFETKFKKLNKSNQISMQEIQQELNTSINSSNGEIKPQFTEVQYQTETDLLTNDQHISKKYIMQQPCDTFDTNQENFKTSYYFTHTGNLLMHNKNILNNHVKDVKSEFQLQCKSIGNSVLVRNISEEECKNLESNDLMIDNIQLKADFCELYNKYNLLFGECQTLKIELEKLQHELNVKDNKIIKLEFEIGKLNHCYEVVLQYNQDLHKDKQSLMDHVNQLSKQNHDLVIQNLEDREYYHIEEYKINDKMMNLIKQKEKLEEKIMDQYKNMSNCSVKKNTNTNVVKSTIHKIRRAGSELFQKRSRRSWAEPSNATERSFDFEYVQGDDSKISLGDNHHSRRYIKNQPRQARFSDVACIARKSDFLKDFRPSDFSFDDRQGHLKARSRKSVDFVSYENDSSDNDIFHKKSSTEDFIIDEEGKELFMTNKSIDLSFEETQHSPDDIIEESSKNKDFVRRKGIKISKTRQEIWSDEGCA